MANNAQGRKWLFVICNPNEHGFTHDVIKDRLMLFSPQYFCISDEISSTGTYHTHGFIFSPSPIRFSTLKNRFPTAHFEKAWGTAQENRLYIMKAGPKHEEKADTSVPNTFEEYGIIPSAQSEKTPMQCQLIQDINNGKRTAEIVEENPSLIFKVKEINTLQQTLLNKKYEQEFRTNLEVIYLYGHSGTGKTKSIYERHPASEICRITNYRKGKDIYFDSYHGQDVLVFEEFNSQIPIELMNSYLDIYPLFLPARYTDRISSYTTVYITSNYPIESQYIDVQNSRPETWKAFLRRIHTIIEFTDDGQQIIKYQGGSR